MKVRIITIVILVGLLAFLWLSGTAQGKTSSQLHAELETLQDQAADIAADGAALQAELDANAQETRSTIEQKSAIDQAIHNTEAQIQNAEAQLQCVSLLIAQSQSDLEAAQQEQQALQEAYRQRLRAMEENGDVSYWAVLFGASSFQDLLSRIDMIHEVAEADQAMLRSLQEKADEVAAQQETLRQELDEQAAIRAELEAMEATLETQRAQADELLLALLADEAALSEEYQKNLEREDALNLIRFNHSSPEFKVRGGETFAQVQARIRETVFRLAAAHPGQTIALFSHGTAIRCLQAAIRGLGPGEMDGLGHSDNTAVTCLEIQGDQARIVFENDNSHLPEEISTLARQKWWKERDGGGGDANLWFRPLNMKKEAERFRAARHEAWQNIHGTSVPFDGDGFVKDALRCWKQDPHKAVMWAMRRDEPAGILQLDLERDAAQGVGYIPFFYMMPQLRCQGLGVQLLGQAVSTFRPLGRTRLRLRCAPDNLRAQRFYQKYGFVKVGEAQGSRVPLDILEKDIGYTVKEDWMNL